MSDPANDKDFDRGLSTATSRTFDRASVAGIISGKEYDAFTQAIEDSIAIAFD
jgi:hypothetical protein